MSAPRPFPQAAFTAAIVVLANLATFAASPTEFTGTGAELQAASDALAPGVNPVRQTKSSEVEIQGLERK